MCVSATATASSSISRDHNHSGSSGKLLFCHSKWNTKFRNWNVESFKF